MTDKRPIGVFDSGLGGLTAVKELMKIMPLENIIYFGDTARVPYGSRSNDTIVRYAMQDMKFILGHKVKAVLVACGTVSSVAIDQVESMSPVFVTGVVQASVNAAISQTKNNKIGVIATQATINAGTYQKLIKQKQPNTEVFAIACPLFVPLVENGYTKKENVAVQKIANDYLSELKEKNIDTLILGCTHYPVLIDVIADIMGKDVILVNSSRESVLLLASRLDERGMSLKSAKKNGICKYFVSDNVHGFSQLANNILGSKEVFGHVEKVDIGN